MNEFQLHMKLSKLKVGEMLEFEDFTVERTEHKDFEILHKSDLFYADSEIQVIILIKSLENG
ncbi:hypothetical protein [Cetobacterium sp.]|uniref:hypothetical protein n=1 Tax=Cetobacterium sp. TaxID=2071632 RepID=UPI003F2D2935